MTSKVPGLIQRLKNGGSVLVAEGILWECERRGYLSFGKYLPEVLLDNPSVVKTIHEEFVHGGTDVVEAFTYFAIRTKLRQYGLEDQLEKMNRTALKIAREVADTSGKLMAGAVCGTYKYKELNETDTNELREMYKEMVEWSVKEGADYIIGETFINFKEAMVAFEAIKMYGKGLPAVITFAAHDPDSTIDNVPLPEACRRMEEAGADVVGLNCVRGPKSMLPLLQEIKNVCKGPIAALPVPFRTDSECRAFSGLRDPISGKLLAYVDAACKMCSRSDIREFAEAAKEMGINYIGLCCGNAPNYFREIAEVYDRKPPASTYRPNFEQAKIFTDNPDPEWYKFIVGK